MFLTRGVVSCLFFYEKMAGVSDVCVSNEDVSEITDGTVRLSKFRNALDRTVRSCVSTVTYDLHKAHFNPKRRNEKNCLHRCHLQLSEKAVELLRDEIVLMIREENVEQLLLKLDDLCKLSTSHSGEVLWRPKGVPGDDVTAHLLAVLLVKRQKLKVLLGDVEAETERMMRAVLERRRIINSLKREIGQNVVQLCQDAEYGIADMQENC